MQKVIPIGWGAFKKEKRGFVQSLTSTLLAQQMHDCGKLLPLSCAMFLSPP